MSQKATIHAKGLKIGIYTNDFENEFISLTDIARYKSDDPNDAIRSWMKSKETIAFLGLWEKIHNPDFKPVEFEGFRNEAGYHAFSMSPQKWIDGVNAIGIVSRSGRYGGTYAHSDIAFEFASWVSAEFKLYIVKDYQRLKSSENSRLSLNWNLNRELSKINQGKAQSERLILLREMVNKQLTTISSMRLNLPDGKNNCD